MERLSREFEKAEIDEDKVIRKLQRMEQSVFKDIEKDIFALFGRYATENNLTYEEAIRLLTSDEYRDFKMDVGSYIKTINNESVDEKAREKLELEYNTLAMKTRISRLEELTYRVNKNLDTLFFVTHRAVKELLEKSVTKSYNSAHTLKRDPSLRDKKLYKILEQPWSGANYSANIWNNRDKLAGIAQNEITKGIYQGKSAKKISKNISERLDASMKDIERVVRTESKHARNEASAQAYIDMGYEWYMFSSHTEGKSSNRTCERCREINEEKYRFDKRVVGENFPPLHPNCRCTIIPIVKDDEIVENEEKEVYNRDKEIEDKIREVRKEIYFKGDMFYKPEKPDYSDYPFAGEHINSQRGHNIDKEKALSFIKNAIFLVVRWEGEALMYYSTEGSTCVNIKYKKITTSFGKEEFDSKVKRIIEVIEDERRKG